jgi:hypothetical protein
LLKQRFNKIHEIQVIHKVRKLELGRNAISSLESSIVRLELLIRPGWLGLDLVQQYNKQFVNYQTKLKLASGSGKTGSYLLRALIRLFLNKLSIALKFSQATTTTSEV